MDEIIKDPIWTFVGVIFAILAVLVMILIFFAQRKTKKLSYEIISNTQLLGVKDEIQGKVQLLYEGKDVKNVHLLTIRFLNNGNQPISSADYERPLSIAINQDAKILTHEIINEEPNNIGTTVSMEDNKLIFSPVLLNSKDSFELKALVSDLEGQPKIDGRINGVKSIAKHNEGSIFFLVIIFVSSVLLLSGIYNIENLEKNESISLLGIEVLRKEFGMVLLIVGYLTMMIAMIKNKLMFRILRSLVTSHL